jgi:hypothetical protein
MYMGFSKVRIWTILTPNEALRPETNFQIVVGSHPSTTRKRFCMGKYCFAGRQISRLPIGCISQPASRSVREQVTV